MKKHSLSLVAKPLDLAAIGIGPFHLSLAAALSHTPQIKARFFDRAPEMRWHAGLMLPGAVMQTCFLKDLITPICPTSPFTFLNYLVENKKFYDFVSARFDTVERIEFAHYLQWAAQRLPSLRFDSDIQLVEPAEEGFHLIGPNGSVVKSHAISVGIGLEPSVPDCARPFLGPDCFHVAEYQFRKPSLEGRRIAVIGGGQSGAEVFLHLLETQAQAAHIRWIDRRPRIAPLEDGAFIDQLFTPEYLRRYQSLDAHTRASIRQEQRFASDGLTQKTIDAIYRHLYRRTHLENRAQAQRVMSGAGLVAMRQNRHGFCLCLEDRHRKTKSEIEADLVLLATGWQRGFPCLEPLRQRLALDAQGNLRLDKNFRALWQQPSKHPLFAFNQGACSHGVAEAQLSLMAWRSGSVVNTLAGYDVFPTKASDGLIAWGVQNASAPGVDKTGLAECPSKTSLV